MAKRKYSGNYYGGSAKRWIGAAGRIAGRMAVNYGSRYIKNKLFKRQSESGVTAQYDKVTQYNKKSMPRGKKRAWKNFSRKVSAVLDKSLGTRTVVFNEGCAAQSTPGFQAFAAVSLYGFCGENGNSDRGFRDVLRICNNDSDIMTYNTDGFNASKIMFKSGIIDLTFRNSGTTPIEVDLYEINVMTDSTKEPNFTTSHAEAVGATNIIPGSSGTSPTLNSRGTTLFDFPNLISQDRMKIYRKRKYFLPIGNTATLQHRDPRNHYFNATDINHLDNNGNGSYGRRKMTQMFVFVAKEVTGTTEVGVNLNIGVTRKYSYTINQSSKALDSHNPA